jgi:arginase
VRGGATYREAHLAMEMTCDSGQMVALEVNRTADLSVELVMPALGKRIL